MLLRKQRLIGRIAPDSGRIVELRIFSGFQKGTLAASHRRAVSASLSSRGGREVTRSLVSWRAPAVSRRATEGAACPFRGPAFGRPNDASIGGALTFPSHRVTWQRAVAADHSTDNGFAPPDLDALVANHDGTVCTWLTRKRCLPNGSMQRAPH